MRDGGEAEAGDEFIRSEEGTLARRNGPATSARSPDIFKRTASTIRRPRIRS